MSFFAHIDKLSRSNQQTTDYSSANFANQWTWTRINFHNYQWASNLVYESNRLLFPPINKGETEFPRSSSKKKSLIRNLSRGVISSVHAVLSPALPPFHMTSGCGSHDFAHGGRQRSDRGRRWEDDITFLREGRAGITGALFMRKTRSRGTSPRPRAIFVRTNACPVCGRAGDVDLSVSINKIRPLRWNGLGPAAATAARPCDRSHAAGGAYTLFAYFSHTYPVTFALFRGNLGRVTRRREISGETDPLRRKRTQPGPLHGYWQTVKKCTR